jgi:NADPH:quinone reductase-like Zn-dependent oxidoreductase
VLAAVCPRYGPPDVLRIQEVPRPDPTRGQVRVRAVQVPARLALGLRGPRRPVLGMAFAGEVDATGPGVTGWRGGERVVGFDRYRSGAHAQYLCTSASGVLAPVPHGLSFQDAAALPYGGLLAMWFLDQAGVTVPGPHAMPQAAPGSSRVLVYGASGAVGTAAVQLAAHAGTRVTAVCGAANAALVTSLGATATLDYTRQDVAAGPGGYDVVFVAVGDRVGPPGAAACRPILAPAGRYLAVDHGRPRLTRDLLTRLCGLVDQHAFRPVLDRSYPLDDIAAAHAHVDAGHARGTVVVTLP